MSSPSASSDSLSSIGASTEPLPASEGPGPLDDSPSPSPSPSASASQRLGEERDDEDDEDRNEDGNGNGNDEEDEEEEERDVVDEQDEPSNGRLRLDSSEPPSRMPPVHRRRKSGAAAGSDSSLTEQSSSEGEGQGDSEDEREDDDDDDDDREEGEMDGDPETTFCTPDRAQASHDPTEQDEEDDDEGQDDDDEADVEEVDVDQHILRNVSSTVTRDANVSTSSAGSVLSDLNEQAHDDGAASTLEQEEEDDQDVVMEPKSKTTGGRGRGGRGARRGATKRGRGSWRGRGGSSKVARQDEGHAYASSANGAMDVDMVDASTAHLDFETPLTPVSGEEDELAPSQDLELVRKSTSTSGRGGRGKRGRGGRGGRGAAAVAARARKRSSTEEEEPSQDALASLDAPSPDSSHSSSNHNPNKRRRGSEEPEQEEASLGVLITDDAQAAEVLGGLLSGDALPPLPGAEVEEEEEGEELEREREGSEEVEGADGTNGGVASGVGEEGELNEDEETDTPGPANDETTMDVDGEEEPEDEEPEPEVEVDEEVPESPKPKGVAGRKAISVKRSKRRTNGKNKAAGHEDDDEDDEDRGSEAESAAVSEHEEEQVSDDAFMRKRAEAMEALTKIEIAFARLRDRLYVERMAEVERDRLAVDTGTHPELIHLTKLIELRRARKLELARNQFNSVYLGYEKQREMAEHKTWVWWADARAELRSTMLDEANSKRRRLEREKRNLDRPQDNTLLNALAPKITPVVPLHHRRRLGLDGETLSENDIAWALRHRDVQADPSVSGLEEDAALSDLERMGLRQSSVHSTVYAYDPIYGAPPGVAAYADPNSGAPMISPYGYATLPYEVALGVPSAQIYGTSMVAPPPPPAMPMNYSPLVAASLPPLPTPHSLPRPPSNPRSNHFSHEPNHQGVGRTSSYPGFGASHAEAEHTPWSSKASASQFKLEENRRRAPSVPGTGGLGEIPVPSERERFRQSYDDASHSNSVPTSSGGSGANGYSLDDHMKHVRSPKTSTSSSTFSASANNLAHHYNNGMSSDVSASSSTHSTPNPNSHKRATPFMSIPAIPPYNPHRHAAAVAAAAATNSPTSSSSSTLALTAESNSVPRTQQLSSSSSSMGKANPTTAVDPAPPILPPLLKS